MEKFNIKSQRKLVVAALDNMKNVIFKISDKIIDLKVSEVSLPIGTEIVAWKGDKAIGAVIVDSEIRELTINEHTTSEWLLKSLKVELSDSSKKQIKIKVKEYLNKGYDIYKIMSEYEFAEAIVKLLHEDKLTRNNVATSMRMNNMIDFGGIAGTNKGWRILTPSESRYEEVIE